MQQRPHLEYSFTARIAESGSTQFVAHLSQNATPVVPSRMLRHFVGSMSQTPSAPARVARYASGPPRGQQTQPAGGVAQHLASCDAFVHG